jgi:hypothetical protein
MSIAVQDVHLQNEVIVIRGTLILVMSMPGLLINLDQLENEATLEFTRWQHRSCLSFLSIHVFVLAGWM